MKTTIFVCCLILAATFIQAQVTRHVPGDYLTIQAAVDAAGYGDTILVDQGRYEENLVIQGNNKVVTLASNFIFTSDSNDIKYTIIDGGNPANPNYGMCVLFKNQDTVLMPKIIGFTLKNGTGYYKTFGGGIHASLAIPVIEHNIVDSCSITGTGPSGAGIRVGQGIWDTNKVCLIRFNIIKNCTINAVSNTLSGSGAGISLGSISAELEGNTITGNYIAGTSSTEAYGGGICYDKYDAIYHTAHLTLLNNTVKNNKCEANVALGGGILLSNNYGWANLIVEGNIISDNEVTSLTTSGNACGGGIYMDNANAGSYLSGNIISNNSAIEGPSNASLFGGGLYIKRTVDSASDNILLIEKNNITGNSAGKGGAICCLYKGIKVMNNFISGNEAALHGGGIYLAGEDTINTSSLINNTVTNNIVSTQGESAGGLIIENFSQVLLMNNIFYGNQAPVADEIQITNAMVQMYYCDIDPEEIDGTYAGEHNFYADPQFIDGMKWDCLNHEAPCSESGIDKVFAFDRWFEAPLIDMFKNIRPQDEYFDVGACEVKLCWVGYPEIQEVSDLIRVSPNPFHEYFKVTFSLPENENVSFGIYDYTGKQVMQVFNGNLAEGIHSLIFSVNSLSPGIYLLKMESGSRLQVLKMVKK